MKLHKLQPIATSIVSTEWMCAAVASLTVSYLCCLLLLPFAVDGPKVAQPYCLTPLDIFERFILRTIFRKAQEKDRCACAAAAAVSRAGVLLFS
jgi:hypothetical protein